MEGREIWRVIVTGEPAAAEDESVPGTYEFSVPVGIPCAEAVEAVLYVA